MLAFVSRALSGVAAFSERCLAPNTVFCEGLMFAVFSGAGAPSLGARASMCGAECGGEGCRSVSRAEMVKDGVGKDEGLWAVHVEVWKNG